MSDSITRTYSLPFGFEATFRWRDAHLDIEWDPRWDFYQDISATIGGNILIVDTDLKTIGGMR